MRFIILAAILGTPLVVFSQDETGAPASGLTVREAPGRLVFTRNGQQIGDFVFRDAKILRPYLVYLRAPDGTSSSASTCG